MEGPSTPVSVWNSNQTTVRIMS